MVSTRAGSFAFALGLVVAFMPSARADIPALLDPAYVRHVRVFRPDGAPALGAVVTALVHHQGDETGTYVPYVFVANAAGVVTIAIPPNDPVIAANRGERLFDVEATVESGGPGVATREAVIPYVLNTGDPLWPTDPTGVENSAVHLIAAPSMPAADDGGHTPDYYPCYWDGYPYTTPPTAWTCIVTTFPRGLQTVPVPVAPNFGAGEDMRIAVTYQNSKSTITSKNVGIDGAFAEVKNSSSFGTDASVRGWLARDGQRGGTPDETLRISAQFKVDQVITCRAESSRCHDYSSVGPDRMIGVLTTSEGASFHDTMKTGGATNEDCGYYLEPTGSWNNTHGTNVDLAYKAGFDLNAQAYVVNFHATTTFTEYNQDVESTSYVWSVIGSTSRGHYVFVPGGNRGYDASKPGGGAKCPLVDPGGTYTDASDDTCKTVDSPCSAVPLTVPPEPEQEAKKAVRRCEQAPERCGRE
jgi:hypothetical protein